MYEYIWAHIHIYKCMSVVYSLLVTFIVLPQWDNRPPAP